MASFSDPVAGLFFCATLYKYGSVDWLQPQRRPSQKMQTTNDETNPKTSITRSRDAQRKREQMKQKRVELRRRGTVPCMHDTRTTPHAHNATTVRPDGRTDGGLTLQVRQLLLRHILARDHVLDNAVDGVQYHLVVAQRQHRVYLSVKQAVSVNGTSHLPSQISTLQAKFHAGRRQIRGWSQTCSELEYGLSRRSATSLGPVCDQNSIMEFGLDQL